MEALRAEGLGADFRHPGQPGWLPPSLSALLPSNGSSESGAPAELSPSLRSSRESGDSGCLSFEERCLINLAKAYCTAPPPPAPAREMTQTKKSHVLLANPKVVLEQSKKYARGALEHFNKRNKIKFELMDVMPINSMPESGNFYTHVNFTARSSKEGSQEQLFFAELQHCSKKKSSSGFLVTSCEPLGPHCTVGHKGFQVDGSVARKNVDFTRCFACSPMMFHPQKGEKYIAGHCNIPYMYDSPY